MDMDYYRFLGKMYDLALEEEAAREAEEYFTPVEAEVDVLEEEELEGDSRGRINACLECTKPDCDNCFSSIPPSVATPSPTYNPGLHPLPASDFVFLYNQKMVPKKMGKLLGCAETTIIRRIEFLGLPKRTRDREHITVDYIRNRGEDVREFFYL